MGGVPVTLLGTGEAGNATGFDHCADKAQVRFGLAGHDAAGRVADLGAVEADSNAAHHLPHVVLSEIGVGTTRTAGGTIEALVDAAQHGVAIEDSRRWMQLKDLLKRHVSPFARASATRAAEVSNGSSAEGSCVVRVDNDGWASYGAPAVAIGSNRWSMRRPLERLSSMVRRWSPVRVGVRPNGSAKLANVAGPRPRRSRMPRRVGPQRAKNVRLRVGPVGGEPRCVSGNAI